MPPCRQPIFNYFPPSFSEVDASLYSYADVLGLLRAVVLVRPVDCYDRTYPLLSGSRSSSRNGLSRTPVTGLRFPSTTFVHDHQHDIDHNRLYDHNRRPRQTGAIRQAGAVRQTGVVRQTGAVLRRYCRCSPDVLQLSLLTMTMCTTNDN